MVDVMVCRLQNIPMRSDSQHMKRQPLPPRRPHRAESRAPSQVLPTRSLLLNSDQIAPVGSEQSNRTLFLSFCKLAVQLCIAHPADHTRDLLRSAKRRPAGCGHQQWNSGRLQQRGCIHRTAAGAARLRRAQVGPRAVCGPSPGRRSCCRPSCCSYR